MMFCNGANMNRAQTQQDGATSSMAYLSMQKIFLVASICRLGLLWARVEFVALFNNSEKKFVCRAWCREIKRLDGFHETPPCHGLLRCICPGELDEEFQDCPLLLWLDNFIYVAEPRLCQHIRLVVQCERNQVLSEKPIKPGDNV